MLQKSSFNLQGYILSIGGGFLHANHVKCESHTEHQCRCSSCKSCKMWITYYRAPLEMLLHNQIKHQFDFFKKWGERGSQGPLILVLKNDFRVWKEKTEMDGLLAFLFADWRGGITGVTQEAIFPPKDGSCEEARSPLLDTLADLFLVVQTVENLNVRSELHCFLQMPPLFFRESKILLKP